MVGGWTITFTGPGLFMKGVNGNCGESLERFPKVGWLLFNKMARILRKKAHNAR